MPHSPLPAKSVLRWASGSTDSESTEFLQSRIVLQLRLMATLIGAMYMAGIVGIGVFAPHAWLGVHLHPSKLLHLALSVALVLGFSGAIALWAFELGKDIAGLDRQAKAELAQLRDEVGRLRQQRDAAQSLAHAADSLLKSDFKIGADASVAAGPVGRTAEAATDLLLKAEILSYSRSRGLFAGVSLNGSVINEDGDANRDFYGRPIRNEQILDENPRPVGTSGKALPEVVSAWQKTLARYAK